MSIYGLLNAWQDAGFQKEIAEFFNSESLRLKVLAANDLAQDKPNIDRARHLASMGYAYDIAFSMLKAHIEKG